MSPKQIWAITVVGIGSDELNQLLLLGTPVNDEVRLNDWAKHMAKEVLESATSALAANPATN